MWSVTLFTFEIFNHPKKKSPATAASFSFLFPKVEISWDFIWREKKKSRSRPKKVRIIFSRHLHRTYYYAGAAAAAVIQNSMFVVHFCSWREVCSARTHTIHTVSSFAWVSATVSSSRARGPPNEVKRKLEAEKLWSSVLLCDRWKKNEIWYVVWLRLLPHLNGT